MLRHTVNTRTSTSIFLHPPIFFPDHLDDSLRSLRRDSSVENSSLNSYPSVNSHLYELVVSLVVQFTYLRNVGYFDIDTPGNSRGSLVYMSVRSELVPLCKTVYTVIC